MRPFYVLLGALIVVGLLVLLFFGIFHPGKTNNNTTTTTAAVVLAEHAGENNTVTFMIDGAVNASEQHRAIKVTITNKSRMLEVIKGYEGATLLSKSFTNSQASYRVFLAGLQNVGYIKQTANTTTAAYLGQCPLGERFIMTTDGFKDVPQLLWVTSCGTKTGNFRGGLSAVQQLFTSQIPDYAKLVSGVQL